MKLGILYLSDFAAQTFHTSIFRLAYHFSNSPLHRRPDMRHDAIGGAEEGRSLSSECSELVWCDKRSDTKKTAASFDFDDGDLSNNHDESINRTGLEIELNKIAHTIAKIQHVVDKREYVFELEEKWSEFFITIDTILHVAFQLIHLVGVLLILLLWYRETKKENVIISLLLIYNFITNRRKITNLLSAIDCELFIFSFIDNDDNCNDA